MHRVLESFVGLGAAVAAHRLGVACVGFDIHRYYLDVARSQLTSSAEDERSAQQALDWR